MNNDDQNVFADPVSVVLDLCRKEFPNQIKAFYEGDPALIPEANLPCIIVEKISSSQDASKRTGFDIVQDIISVRAVLDKSPDEGASDNQDLTERKLRNFIESRDATTRQYRQGTLMHALRFNITLEDISFNTDTSINYDISVRPNMMYTSEGQVLLTTRYYVPTAFRN